MTSTPAAVIFDCDGTLVDSEPLARRAWERSLAPHGYEIDDADYLGLIGLPYPRVHGFFAERIPGLAAPDAFAAAHARTLFALFEAELVPFADATETVRALGAMGVPLAVASSSARLRLDLALARGGFDGAFAVTVAGDEVVHGKPAPDLFLAAAERLGIAPERCAVVEDSGPGVAAGLAAGMRTVAIARPGHGAGLDGADVVLGRLSAEAIVGASSATPRRAARG